MALILKQEANANVTTPPAGSGAVFLNTSDQLTVKDTAGNISTIPTFTATNNTSVFFNDAGTLGESANLTFVKSTNTLSVTGNVVAGGVKTDNLYYANGSPWDLSDPGGNNTQIQFNDNESFGGSANFVWNNSTNTLSVTGTSNVTGTMNVTGNISGGNVNAGNTLTANFVAGTLTTAAQPNITSVGTLSTLTTSGNAVIGGNLTVNGNITYINVETFDVEDPIISVGGGPNGAPLTSNDGKDRGLLMHYYTSAPVDAYMGWDNGNGEFAFGSNVTVSSDIVTYNNLGNVRASTFLGNVSGATGNFTGNITALNADLGNTVTGNYFTGVLTYAAQPNITSVGILTGLQIGATASTGDFANAKSISSQDNSGATAPDNIGLIGEAVANSANANITGIGLLGVARANAATKGTGVQGEAKVTNTADTGAAVGVRGYATDTHAGGYNIGVLGNALGSGVGNYAFYVQNGGIASIENATFWDLTDNSAAAITFNSTGKANIFGIETTDNAEGIFTSGYLNVTGNVSAAGIKTNNYYYANGAPVDFQQAAGSNTQLQFNNNNDFGASANLTFDASINKLTVNNGNIQADNINAGNLLTANFVAGTLTTAAQPNITSVGSLSALTVTGNANVGNLGTGQVIATGNISAPNFIGNLANGSSDINIPASGGNINFDVAGNANVVVVTGTGINVAGTLNATGNANVGNLGATDVVATTLGGTLTTAAQPNITSVGTLTSVAVTGNATAGNVYANSGTIGASLLTGTLTTAAQPNVTSVGTLVNATVTGNVIAGNVYANSGTLGASFLTGTLTTAAQPNITSVGTLTSATVSGNVTAGNVYANSGTIGASSLTGTLTTAAQPNITSVGTLTSATVSGNVTAGNVYANSGTIGASLLTGTLTTAAQPNITSVGTLVNATVTGNVTAANFIGNLANGNSDINIPAANGNINFDVAGNANVLVVTGTGANIAGTLNATGNANVGNLGATGVVATTLGGALTTAAQPNITSVGTLTSASVTGNVTAGNVYANSGTIGASLITGTLTTAAQPNVTSVGTLTSVAVTGNATAGNVYANSGTIGASLLTGTLTTASQPNITSVGTLTSLTVTGNVTAGNLVGILANGNSNISIPSANGNINISAGGTPNELVITSTGVNVAGTLNATGNANVGNLGTAGLITATGNVSGGNLTTAGVVSATGNVSGGNLTTAGVVSATGNVSGGNLTTAGVLTVTGTGQSSINGNLAMNSKWVTGLSDPVNDQDAATKKYVDEIAQGLHTHDACQAATPDTLANVTGGTITYNNGASGVGANLVTTGSFNLIDGVNVQTAGTRILVKNEANTAHNGIYVWSNATVITRADDFNTPAEMAGGDFTFVQGGTLYDNTGWVMPDPVTTVGTSPVVWLQFSGAGTYTAGTGLTLTGSQFSISNTAVTAASYGNGDRVASFTVNSQGQLTAASNVVIAANAANLTGTTLASSIVNSSLTSVGTLSSLGVNGTVTAVNFTANTGVFAGSGANLTNLNASNISSGTLAQARLANSSLTVNGTAISLGGSGTITANTTQTLTLGTYLTGTSFNGGTAVTATVDATTTNTASKVVARDANGSFSANIITATLSGSATSATTAGTVTTAAQPNITSVGTLTSLGVNGTVTAAAFTANTGVFTGNGSGLSAIAGANVTGTVSSATSATTAGTVTTAAQPNITSVGTLTSLAVTGNASAGNLNTAGAVVASTLTSNVATGTAPLTVTSTTRVSNLNVAYANVADFINASAGTGNNFIVFANAATGNVSELTSTGLTANLSNNSITATTFVGAVSGDLSAGTNVNASNISSGTLAQARLANSSLTVNGTSISLGGSGTVTANTTQTLTFSNAGSGDASGTTFNGGTARTISYNSVGAPSTTGTNASGSWGISVTGSAATAGTVTTAAQPNITSVGTLTGLTSSGAVSITNSTAATSRTTGALIVTGGIGASANSFFTNLNVASNIAYVSPNGANTINSQMLNGGTLAWSGNAGQLFSITDSMTGNIFSVNDVSGIPMIAVDAGGNIYFAASGGFVAYGVSTGISAAGSTQGTATALTRPINVVSTVSASQGVILPATVAGMRILVFNTSGTAVNVYPPSGGVINSAATNAAYSLPAGGRLEFVSTTTTQWYTMNATYA